MRKITLFKENDVQIDLNSIVENLNKICKNIAFKKGKSNFFINDSIVKYPETYTNLSKSIKDETKNDLLSFFVTKKQYDNNYFFEALGNSVILSFYGWDYLTKLSENSGLVFFIADLLALQIDDTYCHQDTTGCIYDFGWDKTGIDTEMRLSFICPRCLTRINTKKLSKLQNDLFVDLKGILNVLSITLKWNLDIVDCWKSGFIKLITSHNKEIKKKQIITQPDFIPEKDEEDYIKISRRNINELCKSYLELTDENLPIDKKGKVFEQFTQHFFGLIKGWEIIECNANLQDCEIDIIYDTTKGPEILRSKLGDNIYVECKNRTKKSDVRDVSHFILNLKSRGLKSGIFFSYSGITGYSPDNWRNVDAAYKRILDVCRQEKIYVLAMVSQDVELIRNGGNLVEHILELFNRFIRI